MKCPKLGKNVKVNGEKKCVETCNVKECDRTPR
jgi:hypothetical protein